MSIAEIKKVLKLGGSLAIVLPGRWAKGKVKPGQEVVVVGNEELRIILIPEKGETAGNVEKKNASSH